jgi:Glycosyl hydrolases family 8
MLTIALGLASAMTLAADGEGAYATGRYRDLFVEAGHSEQEVDARIARAFEQLFRGDERTQRLYFPSGENENGPLAYIPDIQHTDVRSEGMSYGMMIAVQLNRKSEFDALWNWSRLDERRRLSRRDRRSPRGEAHRGPLEPRGAVERRLPLLRRPPVHDEPPASEREVPDHPGAALRPRCWSYFLGGATYYCPRCQE